MLKMKAEDAVGKVLGHDLTRIVPGEFKGAVFKKGHIIGHEDIPMLLDTGNDEVYVLDLDPGELHEDDAALRIATVAAGPGIEYVAPEEGKVVMRSRHKGLVRIDVDLLAQINASDDIIVSTLHDYTPCGKGIAVAATRIIPLTIAQSAIEDIEARCAKSTLIDVAPYILRRVGAVVTGNEVFYGRIMDSFDTTVAQKVAHYGAAVVKKITVPDDVERIAEALHAVKDAGVEVLLTTGGLSVDPGDVTRLGIKKAGTDIVSYGSPVLPGAMFLYGLLEGIPLLGLPACVFYSPATIFDLIFPRVVAGLEVTRADITQLGHGGLCLSCRECRYPVCHFGKS
jgi:molybdenum cofactor synthesis domain-containing protein